MATPHVAGAAALALAAKPVRDATWELKQALLISVDAKPPLAGLSVTGGRLNADRAVVAVNGPLPSADPATPTPDPADRHAGTAGRDARRRSPPAPPVTPRWSRRRRRRSRRPSTCST